MAFEARASCDNLSKKSDPDLLFACLKILSDRIGAIEQQKLKTKPDNECPDRMVNAGSFCIDKKLRFPRGTNWLDNNDGCIRNGLRLCSTAEISGAVRLGLIETYKISQGNHWVWSDDAVLNQDKGEKVYDACHIELNTDEANYDLGEWNCQVPATQNHSAIGGICCK